MLPLMLAGFQTFNNSLPYNIPPGWFLTTWDRIRIFAAICFILGWLANALINYMIDSIKKGKAINQTLKEEEGKEVNNCQVCQSRQN